MQICALCSCQNNWKNTWPEMRRGKEKEVAKWCCQCYNTGLLEGHATGLSYYNKLYFPLGKETWGSCCTAQVGSHFRLLSAAPVRSEEPETEKKKGFFLFFFLSKVGCCFMYGCFSVVRICCSSFCACLAWGKHISHFIGIKQSHPDGYSS